MKHSAMILKFRPSVCLFVRHTLVLCQTAEHIVEILPWPGIESVGAVP